MNTLTFLNIQKYNFCWIYIRHVRFDLHIFFCENQNTRMIKTMEIAENKGKKSACARIIQTESA
jgi:hypothetical protein